MKNLFIILILPFLIPFSLFAQVEPIWYGEYNDIRQMEDPTFIGENDEQFVMAEVYVPEGETYFTNVYKMETLTGKKLDSIYFEYVVRELEYDKTNNLLYVGGDSLVKVDVESFEVLKRYPLPPPPFEGQIKNHRITKIALSPNDKYIIGEGVSRELFGEFEYRLYLFDTEAEEFVMITKANKYLRRKYITPVGPYEFIFDPTNSHIYYIEDNMDPSEENNIFYLCKLEVETGNIEKQHSEIRDLFYITKSNNQFHLITRNHPTYDYLYQRFSFDNLKNPLIEINLSNIYPKNSIQMAQIDSLNNQILYITNDDEFQFNFLKAPNFEPIFIPTSKRRGTLNLSPTELYIMQHTSNTISIYDYQALLTATLVTEERDQSSILFNNPVEEILHIKSAEIKINKVEILDINGKVQKNIEMKNTEMDINISELPTGIYFLRVFSSHNSNTYKFIKE